MYITYQILNELTESIFISIYTKSKNDLEDETLYSLRELCKRPYRSLYAPNVVGMFESMIEKDVMLLGFMEDMRVLLLTSIMETFHDTPMTIQDAEKAIYLSTGAEVSSGNIRKLKIDELPDLYIGAAMLCYSDFYVTPKLLNRVATIT